MPDTDRAPAEIEQEIVEQRAQLEADLSKLAHAVREKVDIPAKVATEARKRPLVVFAGIGVALLLGMALGARRARLNRALALLDA